MISKIDEKLNGFGKTGKPHLLLGPPFSASILASLRKAFQRIDLVTEFVVTLDRLRSDFLGGRIALAQLVQKMDSKYTILRNKTLRK